MADFTQAERQLIEAIRARASKRQTEHDRPPFVWPYIRWSDASSTESGLTLDTQKGIILEYAAKLLDEMPEGTRIIDPVVDESIKASKVIFRKRPGGQRIWHNVRPGDVVVVYKADRWARNMADFASSLQKLLAKNVQVHFVQDRLRYTDDPNDRLHAHILGVFADHFSAQLSARMKDVAAQLKKRGARYGRPRIWEEYRGEVGYKYRVAVEETWQECIQIYLAKERHGWHWTTISEWMEAIQARKEKRPPILTKNYLARKWPPRRCGYAHQQVSCVARRDLRLRRTLRDLAESDIPLDQLGERCPPPYMRWDTLTEEEADARAALVHDATRRK